MYTYLDTSLSSNMYLRLSLLAVICLGLASAGPVIPAKGSPAYNSFICDTCLQVTQLVYDEATSNMTEDTVRQALDSACGLLPGANRTEKCREFLDRYVDKIFAFLREALDPETFCFTLGLCREKLVRVEDEIKKLDNEIWKEDYQPETKAVVDLKSFWADMITTMEIVSEFGDDSTVDCMMCDTIVDATIKTKGDGTPMYEIFTNALGVCDMMKGNLREKCTNFVYLYMDAMIEMIKEKSDLSTFCPAMGICYDDETMFQYDPFFMKETLPSSRRSDDAVESAPRLLVQDVIENLQDSSDTPCYICEWLVNEVERWATEKKTEDEIKQYLTETCTYLPEGSYRDKCEALVNEYADTVIDLIINEGMKPDAVCQKIGYCKSAWFKIADALPVKKEMKDELKYKIALKDNMGDDGIFCEMCKEMAVELKELFDANKDKIQKMLEGLCDRIPAPYGEQCHKELDENFPMIVMLIDNMILNPDTMCDAIGACTATEDIIVETILEKEQSGETILEKDQPVETVTEKDQHMETFIESDLMLDILCAIGFYCHHK
ncbi:prosaposin-like [Glandiceps talaboti]